MNTNRYVVLPAGPEESKEIALEDRMPITSGEQTVMAFNAIAAGLGTTSGLIVEGLWFFTSDVESGGLGVIMMGGTAAGAISIVGIVSALAAIPIAYITYRELMIEAEMLVKTLQDEARLRDELHEKIFFELLRLRCLYNNITDFSYHAHRLLQASREEVDSENLISHVVRIYERCREKTFAVTWRYADNLPPVLRESKDSASVTLTQVLRNPNIVHNEKTRLSLTHSVLGNENIHRHFKSIPELPVTNRKTAIGYGLVAGLSVAGFSLGSGWAFGALVVGAGLAATIPVAGWAVLAVGSIVMGAMFGLGIGIYKQKNVQRRALNDAVKHRNKLLLSAEENLHRANNNLSQLKHEVDVHYEHHHEMPGVENTKEIALDGLLSPRLKRSAEIPAPVPALSLRIS